MAGGQRPHELRGPQRVPGQRTGTAMEEVHRAVPEPAHTAAAW